FRTLPINEFEEIEADPHTIDADQTRDVLDMIDITVQRGLLLCGTDQDRIDTNDAPALTDHFDLLVADVALNIVKFSGVRVRNNQRLRCEVDNLFEARWIDVGKV